MANSPGRKKSKAAKKTKTIRLQVPRDSTVSGAYLALVAAYPIHPIRSHEDLDAAVAVIDRLLGRRRPLDPAEQEYLDSLSHEVERYEEAEVEMPAVSGAALLRHLMEAKEVTQADLARETGIASSTVSALLSGKRQLTRQHVEKLAGFFNVKPGVFWD